MLNNATSRLTREITVQTVLGSVLGIDDCRTKGKEAVFFRGNNLNSLPMTISGTSMIYQSYHIWSQKS